MADQENRKGILGDRRELSNDKPVTGPAPLTGPKLPVLGLDDKLPVIEPREDSDSSPQ